MSNLRIPEHLRLTLAAADSPTTFADMPPDVGFSPVTNLAMNLSGTSLGSTPRRRLSLSSLDNTPTPVRFKTLSADYGDTDSSAVPDRLLKNSIKLSNSNGGNLSRARGFSRRINLPSSPRCSSAHNDKENMGCSGDGGAPEVETLSFLHNVSPTKHISSPSKFAVLRHNSSPLRQRQPLEDQDPNSQDSGYGAFVDKEDAKSGFRFVEPSAVAPRKHLADPSPRKENSPVSSPQNKTTEHSKSRLFHSLSSGSESIDDGFTDLLDLDKVEEAAYLPSGISSLLSGPIIRDHHFVGSSSVSPKEDRPKPIFQRSLSLVENLTPASSRISPNNIIPYLIHKFPSYNKKFVSTTSSPLACSSVGLSSSKARHRLFKSSTQTDEQDDTTGLVQPDALRSFKRPEPPADVGPLQTKRRKSCSLHSIRENVVPTNSPTLQRSFSETEATIKKALQRSTQIPDLIGDFSKPFILPLMEGRHQDLKTISADTLASVMNGLYGDDVESYTIIDCRYPYEYEGGHIKGARNIYSKEQIMKEFVENHDSTEKCESSSGTKRNILVFHCEFSSERGPSLFRFLRNSDRDQNKESYPALNYPEVYLLHGGYKSFFEKHSDKCEPCAYRPMLDPNHETDLRVFRSKSKSWNGDSKSRLALRSNLKRLGL